MNQEIDMNEEEERMIIIMVNSKKKVCYATKGFYPKDKSLFLDVLGCISEKVRSNKEKFCEESTYENTIIN